MLKKRSRSTKKRDLIVRMEGLEPAHLSEPDPKSGVSTNFTTPAISYFFMTPYVKVVIELDYFFSNSGCKDKIIFLKTRCLYTFNCDLLALKFVFPS